MKRNLISTRELSERTNLTKRQIYRLVEDKRLPAIKISRKRLLFDEEEVEKALRQASTLMIGV